MQIIHRRGSTRPGCSATSCPGARVQAAVIGVQIPGDAPES